MITVDAGILARAMKRASGIVLSANTMPILGNVRLIADGDTLEITTSDLDTEYRQTLPLAQGGKIATTVDAKRLAALAGAVDNGARIAIEEEGGRLIVKAGRSRWQLPTIPAKDFPPMPADGLSEPVDIAAPRLAEMLGRLTWAIGVEVSQPWYCGVTLTDEDGRLRIYASDGIVMMAVDTGAAFPKEANPAIVPAKFADTLKRIAGDSAGTISLAWDERKIRASEGDTVITGKLIDYKPVNFRRLIDQLEQAKTGDSAVIVEPAALRTALRRIELVADAKSRTVRVTCAPGVVSVGMTAADSAAASDEIPAEATHEAEAGFNVRHLANLLDAVGGDTVELHNIKPAANVLVHRKVPDGALAIISAMKS